MFGTNVVVKNKTTYFSRKPYVFRELNKRDAKHAFPM
jgi:hypothetical protein